MASSKKRKSLTASSDGFNPLDVIRIVLDVAGHSDIPSNRKDIGKKKLVENLNYTDTLMDLLQIELDKYVKKIKSTAAVSDGDLSDVTTVQDVIDVIEKIINP